EGIDSVARNEFLCTSSSANGGQGLIVKQTGGIHGVGLLAADYQDMSQNGASLIWSPRSDITLYRHTADGTIASRTPVRIALGTDWMPAGSMNLLRELKCADSFNTTYLDHFFTDEDLWRMVTVNAAGVAGVGDVVGTLAKGMVGDVAIFDESTNDGYRAV